MAVGKKFNWWEALGTGIGGAAGGIGGFFLGGPAGALAGGVAGAELGQRISPGGFWNQSNVPTRQASGISGDIASNQTADFFRNQLNAQSGGQIAQINQQFGPTRYGSGQRHQAIQDVLAGNRGAFQDFLGKSALERFLTQQKITSAEGIAQAQIDASGSGNRAQLSGQIAMSIANILAQNPEYAKWAWNKGSNLFGSGGGGTSFETQAGNFSL